MLEVYDTAKLFMMVRFVQRRANDVPHRRNMYKPRIRREDHAVPHMMTREGKPKSFSARDLFNALSERSRNSLKTTHKIS